MRRLNRILTLSPSDRRGQPRHARGKQVRALGLLDLARETDPLACRGSLDRIGGWLNGKEFGVRIARRNGFERGFPIVAPEVLRRLWSPVASRRIGGGFARRFRRWVVGRWRK